MYLYICIYNHFIEMDKIIICNTSSSLHPKPNRFPPLAVSLNGSPSDDSVRLGLGCVRAATPAREPRRRGPGEMRKEDHGTHELGYVVHMWVFP